MHSARFHLPFSPVVLVGGITASLLIVYIGLIAVVMTYATLTVEFSQSVRENAASVAVLESQYLSTVADITAMDYHAAGYTLPVAKIFVRAKGNITALH